MKRHIIGIDIGGTKFSVVMADTKGRILVKRSGPTGINSEAGESMERMLSAIDAVKEAAKVPMSDIMGIGVACVGTLDPVRGVLIAPPNLPRWRNVPLKKIITSRFPLSFIIDNDCNACGLGEKYFGAGKNVRNLFYFTVSTGIGGGMVVNGRIHQGSSFDAGEVGHHTVLPDGPRCNCGKSGCLEALASGTAIAKRARAMVKSKKNSLIFKLAKGDINSIDARIVYKAAKQGDAVAKSICEESAWYLGIGVANVMQIFNPEMVILGGSITKTGKMLFDPVRRSVREHTWGRVWKKCPVVRAKLGDNVADVGAISLVLADTKR